MAHGRSSSRSLASSCGVTRTVVSTSSTTPAAVPPRQPPPTDTGLGSESRSSMWCPRGHGHADLVSLGSVGMSIETTPAPERRDPPVLADEREMLDSWLDFHRATLLMKCQGLGEEQLKTRSVPPSSLSLLGLVRHMLEVEQSWFLRVFRGEDAPPRYYSDDNPDGDFDDVDTADAAADIAAYHEMADRCRAAARGLELDSVGVGLRRGRQVGLRWIYVHMIEEYARHNGHADLLRE